MSDGRKDFKVNLLAVALVGVVVGMGFALGRWGLDHVLYDNPRHLACEDLDAMYGSGSDMSFPDWLQLKTSGHVYAARFGEMRIVCYPAEIKGDRNGPHE